MTESLRVGALAVGVSLFAGIAHSASPDTQKTPNSPKAPKTKTGRAGPRLYNKQLDDKAQSALAISKNITNGALWDMELHNIDLLSQKSQARILASARRLALEEIAELVQWRDVQALREQVMKDLSLNDFADAASFSETKEKLTSALGAAKGRMKLEPSPSTGGVFGNFKAISDNADSALTAAEQVRQRLGFRASPTPISVRPTSSPSCSASSPTSTTATKTLLSPLKPRPVSWRQPNAT